MTFSLAFPICSTVNPISRFTTLSTDLTDPYNSRYYEAHKHFLNRRMLTIEYFHKELVIDEEAVGFQFRLSDQIADLSKKHAKEWNPSLQKQIAHTLYNRNLHYFYTALNEAESGFCDPCYNNLRTIYESILKMYYLWAYPSETENVQKDIESEKRPRYDHEYLIQRLYSRNMQESLRTLYRGLSVKAHSNYSGIASTLNYSSTQVKDCLQAILLLSFYNITAQIENQSSEPSILEKPIVDEVGSYLEKLRQLLIDERGEMGTFFPDKPELWKRLSIKPDIDLESIGIK